MVKEMEKKKKAKERELQELEVCNRCGSSTHTTLLTSEDTILDGIHALIDEILYRTGKVYTLQTGGGTSEVVLKKVDDDTDKSGEDTEKPEKPHKKSKRTREKKHKKSEKSA